MNEPNPDKRTILPYGKDSGIRKHLIKNKMDWRVGTPVPYAPEWSVTERTDERIVFTHPYGHQITIEYDATSDDSLFSASIDNAKDGRLLVEQDTLEDLLPAIWAYFTGVKAQKQIEQAREMGVL